MDDVSHDDLMRLRTDGSANIAIIQPRHQGWGEPQDPL